MLPLIDILIILSGISAAQAGLIRRYVNSTSQVPQAMTGVAYQPYAGSPSLSLGPIQGITTLPFSQLVETPAEIPIASSASAPALSESSTAIVTRVASFQYQPTGAETNDNDATSSTPCKSQSNGPPTSFWTFGDQHVGTVTRTSTTYITVSVPPPTVESPSSQGPTISQVQSTSTLSVSQTSHTFSFDPLAKKTDPATTESDAATTASEISATNSPPKSSTQDSSSATSTFAYPYPDSDPATTSSTATDPQDDDATKTSIESSSPTYYSDLPVVVTEGTPPETQSQQSAATTTNSTAIPGITIIPQNPSVIYITVTDAGATTTVTA
ncbi:hypothetical protein MBLNU13_g08357t1 [Cladosporium sp. NU13]